MSNKKGFHFYFCESMRSAGIPESAIPTAMFDSATTATSSILVWTEAAKMIGARATLGELVAAVTTGGGISASGAGVIAIGTLKAGAGLLASYWLGCVIGSTIYAIQMLTVGDSWLASMQATDMLRLEQTAKYYKVPIPAGVRDTYQLQLARNMQAATSTNV